MRRKILKQSTFNVTRIKKETARLSCLEGCGVMENYIREIRLFMSPIPESLSISSLAIAVVF